VQALQAPLGDPQALLAAVRERGGAQVLVHAMNPLYTDWDREAMPLAQAAMDLAQALGATLLFPGNVYNFGSNMPARLQETTPQQPDTRKGQIRRDIEAAMQARAANGLRSIVLRAGDFFGGPGAGSWMDQAIIKDLAKGKIVYPGPLHLQHAWAYLPDMAQAMVALAERHEQFAAFESFHFAGHTLTGVQLVQALEVAARRNGVVADDAGIRLGGIPWPMIRILGWFKPMLAELFKMRYLWHVSHQLQGDKLARAAGPLRSTSLDQALDATLRELGMASPTRSEAAGPKMSVGFQNSPERA
jgi:hypothetical protein